MKGKEPKKKIPFYVPILWVFTTVTWIIVAVGNSTVAGFSHGLLAVQYATAILSGGAAIVNYIRYKRGKGDGTE